MLCCFIFKGDGKCVICDSYVRPCTLVRICDECNYGSYQGRCVICGGPGVSDAYYCKECTITEKDVCIQVTIFKILKYVLVFLLLHWRCFTSKEFSIFSRLRSCSFCSCWYTCFPMLAAAFFYNVLCKAARSCAAFFTSLFREPLA